MKEKKEGKKERRKRGEKIEQGENNVGESRKL